MNPVVVITISKFAVVIHAVYFHRPRRRVLTLAQSSSAGLTSR